MNTVKTCDLEGAALDWAVAQVEGRKPSTHGGVVRATAHPDFPDSAPMFGPELHYSTDPAQGHPIIEREGIALRPGLFIGASESGKDVCERTAWIASMGYNPHLCRYRHEAQGPTALIAAMRCYVASKLGDAVDIPEILA